jgi:hypothetical protein
MSRVAFAQLLACVLCASTAFGQVSQNLKEEIDKAVDAQQVGEAISTVSQQIKIAPAARLTAGTGDIATNGECAKDIDIYCVGIRPGYGHLAECLQNQILDERESATEFMGKVSQKCKDELIHFKMALAQNINMDVGTAAACQKDAERLCAFTEKLDFPGKVIACLRSKNSSLSGKCRSRITMLQLRAAEDYRLQATLYDACKGDAKKFCKDVDPESVNACLRDHRKEVRQHLFLFCLVESA